VFKVIFSSDFHIGLITSEISRVYEIIAVLMKVVKHAVKIKADCVVFGGDIFDNNNPSEYLISQFMKVLNVLQKHDILVFIMVGNHDAISKPGRVSCLSFLKEIQPGYPNIVLIDKVKCIRIKKCELGNIYFTFLPHITKSEIPDKYKTVQQYLDKKANKIQKKLPEDCQHFVFSHLNVKGVIPGSEEYLLKKSEIFIPKIWEKEFNSKVRPAPYFIQAHIHTRQKPHKRFHIVGSPTFVDFGEKEKKKYYLELQIPMYLGEGDVQFNYKRSPCLNFKEVSMHLKKHDKIFCEA